MRVRLWATRGQVCALAALRSRAHFCAHMQVLERMEHRGGCGCEVNTGDGSGILLAIPDGFYRSELKAAGVELPPDGRSHMRACVHACAQ